MDRLEFHRSRAKHVGLVFVALIFVIIGVAAAITGDKSDRAMGLVGAVFFGAVAAIGVKRAMQGGVAFVFDREGISSEEIDIGTIPWSEVESCRVVSLRGTRMLSLSFRDPERFLAQVSPTKRKLASFNESMGWGHWAFSFTGVTPGIDEALKFIEENIPSLTAAANA